MCRPRRQAVVSRREGSRSRQSFAISQRPVSETTTEALSPRRPMRTPIVSASRSAAPSCHSCTRAPSRYTLGPRRWRSIRSTTLYRTIAAIPADCTGRRKVRSGRFQSVEAKHDVLVVGAGCAGMRAAIEAHDAGADVQLISRIHPARSHSGAAEGGINAALGNASEDDPEKHAFDTVKGSDYLGDQDAIEILCQEAPADVYQLEHWGAVFSRTEDGRIAQRPFGAAGAPRTAYAADITGHVLLQVLYEQLSRRELKVYDEYFAWRLVVDD